MTALKPALVAAALAPHPRGRRPRRHPCRPWPPAPRTPSAERPARWQEIATSIFGDRADRSRPTA